MKSLTSKILLTVTLILYAAYSFYFVFKQTFAKTEAEAEFYAKVMKVSLLGEMILLVIILFVYQMFFKNIEYDDNDD